MPPGFLNRNVVLTPLTEPSGPVGGAIVPLEPEFRPDTSSDRAGLVDDGRIENRISRMFTRGRSARVDASSTGFTEPQRVASRPPAQRGELCFYGVDLPPENKLKPVQIEQLIGSLINSLEFISFETIANESDISFQFAALKSQSKILERQLRSHLPDFDIRTSTDALDLIDVAGRDRSIVVPFAITDHWFRPMRTGSDFAADPLIPLIAAFDGIGSEETACVQVMFARTRYPWQPAARQQLFDDAGKARYANVSGEQAKGIRQKLSEPLAAASVRILVIGGGPGTSTGLARQIMPYFKQFGDPNGNSLVPVRPVNHATSDTAENVLARNSRRSGILLSISELSSLVRFPSDTVRSVKLKRSTRKEKRAPEITAKGSIVLGRNLYQNESREVHLSPEQRTRHMHVIGASGSGKTTLLLSLAKSDMDNADASCIVVDPHGDLTDAVMANVPDGRLGDVVLFDPSDAEYPIGFNILQANSPLEKTILSSDLVATFRRMATSWGDVMDSVLANAVLAFLESTRGGTLFDLRRFLVEKEFREDFLRTVTDDSVKYFWEHEFQLIAGKPQASILMRLDVFLRQPLVRNLVCQKENKLDFRRLMDERKIVLIKLSQGLIGEENAYLLGTMILSRIYQAALSRQDSHDRPYCWLLVDEFHHLVTPSLESVLSGARKYNLGLTLGHQQFKQIQTRSQDVASSVLSNCYTRVCFRLGDTDAEKFAGGFSSFDAKALQNLGIGEAIARIERADYDFNLRVEAVPRVDPDIAKTRIDAIRALSRNSYGRLRNDVEAELRATRASSKPAAKKPAGVPGQSSDAVEAPRIGPAAQPTIKEDHKPTQESVTEHAYLQHIAKRIGEKCGFRSTIELPVMGGVGRVDVALENETLRVAVEIARTNTSDYELNNIQKCLAAGFDRVVVLSTDTAHLRRIRLVAEEALEPRSAVRLHFLDPEQLEPFLRSLPSSEFRRSPSEEKIKGYTVKTVVRHVSESEAKAKRELIREILDRGLR